ncbi:DNA recombination protein rmuC [Acholeplasma oculi]|uniref:DNA recombination protein RmuC n=1 Tax=Acholeplasma oculi TaxID=35623 RepID=A0A061ACG6_9MOLU|nr:DNA recombination protein RmuC [Acholeplasma oculi]CDR31538.1 DNA recombination protein RmuC [Acholeplasma oculi]SKC49888.1 DNA recombination protein RmuC [Acholeplasma oculi]SUT92400.1 DNA recombination protein rmuC [Acholeplasma oculi]
MTEPVIWILAIISILLFIAVIILMVIILKPKAQSDLEYRARNQQELLSKLESLKVEVAKELEILNSQTKGEIKDQLNTFKETISTKVQTDISSINDRVENRLKEGFKSTSELFDVISNRLVAIDHTQKNIEKLSGHVDDLSKLLSDKKLRGMYGEVQLYHILDNVFGENNKDLYEKQKKLSNQTIVDALIYGPDGLGHIPIDSKFSLENYVLMNNPEASKDEQNQAARDFKINIKKHIDDISNKYIITPETANQAIMFIPSEAVFSEVQSKHLDLIEYAQKKHVWITSPTTLVYMLSLMMVLNSNASREKNALRMLQELQAIYDDFKRFFDRFSELQKILTRLNEATSTLDITVGKINRKVYMIENSEFDTLEDEKKETT